MTEYLKKLDQRIADFNKSGKIPIKGSYLSAAVIALAVSLWILSGYVGANGNTKDNDVQVTQEDALMQVRTVLSHAKPHTKILKVRGFTEAARTVTVQAETVGRVIDVPTREGSRVKQGDVLCQLSMDAREAKHSEAISQANQAKLEYEAAKQLRAKGHRSETQEAAAEAAYKRAEALVKQIELDIERTNLRAPFDGIMDQRQVDIGEYMQVGHPCATVIDDSSMMVIGQVSEKEVLYLQDGQKSEVRLFNGEVVPGRVRFIGVVSDQATRTFRVEFEIANEGGHFREGITSEVFVDVGSQPAHFISPSILILDETGQLGVRIVDDQSIATFKPVTIIDDSRDGLWVSGLPETVEIITVGQEYVTDGQKVETHQQHAEELISKETSS